jgi:hypothetical protein
MVTGPGSVKASEVAVCPGDRDGGWRSIRSAVSRRAVSNPLSALGRIRTCDLPLRRRLLYPLSYEGGAFASSSA